MREILKKDATLRIVSLFIAIILWLYVVDIQNPETEIFIKDIPVEFININALDDFGLMIMNEDTQTVTLKVKGRRKTLANLSNQDIKAVADLRGLNKTGEHPVMIHVVMPTEDVDIIEKRPYNVNIKLDTMVQVQKEIKVVAKGAVKAPYISLTPQVKPNIVTLKAPSTIINSIGDVRVVVDVSDHNGDIVTKQKYEIYNKQNEKINSSSIIADVDTIEVFYPIRKMKEVPVVPRILGIPAQDYVITNTKVVPDKVKIIGRDEVVDNTERIFTEPINIENLTQDKEVEVPLQLDRGVSLLDGGNTAKIKIDIEKQITRTISVENIRVYNVPEELSYKLATKTIDVKLRGIESKMKLIESDDIYASIDIYGLAEGPHEVPIRILTDEDIEVVGSYIATITLSRQTNDRDETKPVTNPENDETSDNTSDSGENSSSDKTDNTNDTDSSMEERDI